MDLFICSRRFLYSGYQFSVLNVSVCYNFDERKSREKRIKIFHESQSSSEDRHSANVKIMSETYGIVALFIGFQGSFWHAIVC